MKASRYFIFYLLFIFFAGLSWSCRGNHDDSDEFDNITKESFDVKNDNSSPVVAGRIRVRDVGPLYQTFNDSNNTQLEYARKLGINPVTDLSSAYFTNRPIVHIESNEYYRLDTLTHSLPYLVPEAAILLQDIGRSFNDSLKARGGKGNYIKVTSLLRTPETVSRLRKVNINATDSSTHQYATTFDISYTNFYCPDEKDMVNQGDLKNLLAEVLAEMREKGRCLVKFERKTGCFHVTVTH